MKFRYCNEFKKVFTGKDTVAKIIDYVLALEQEGWLLDISTHSDGITIDSEGITVCFVKISETKEEAPNVNEFILSAQRALTEYHQERRGK